MNLMRMHTAAIQDIKAASSGSAKVRAAERDIPRARKARSLMQMQPSCVVRLRQNSVRRFPSHVEQLELRVLAAEHQFHKRA
jgi:hypothetical protein